MDPDSFPGHSQSNSNASGHYKTSRRLHSRESSNPYSDSGPEVALIAATIRSINQSQAAEDIRNAQKTPPASQASPKTSTPSGNPSSDPGSASNPYSDSASNPYSNSGSARSLITTINKVIISRTVQDLKTNQSLHPTRNPSENSLNQSAQGRMLEGMVDRDIDSEDSSHSSVYHPSPPRVTFRPLSPAEEVAAQDDIDKGGCFMQAETDGCELNCLPTKRHSHSRPCNRMGTRDRGNLHGWPWPMDGRSSRRQISAPGMDGVKE